MEDVNEELGCFLYFVAEGTAVDEFTGQLEKEVEPVKCNEEWKHEYMILMTQDMENIELGRGKGREERIRL